MDKQSTTRHSEAHLPIVQRERSDPPEPDHSMTVGRVEAFSDGVFGVAVTLLILNIQVPQLGREQPLSALLAAVRDLWPAFLTYGLTFVTIGSVWILHHQFLVTAQLGCKGARSEFDLTAQIRIIGRHEAQRVGHGGRNRGSVCARPGSGQSVI